MTISAINYVLLGNQFKVDRFLLAPVRDLAGDNSRLLLVWKRWFLTGWAKKRWHGTVGEPDMDTPVSARFFFLF